MHIDLNPKLDFRDVLIRPKRSVLSSRFEANINRSFRFRHSSKGWTGFPLIASNMDTIGTLEMASAFRPFDALVALHKFHDPERLVAVARTAMPTPNVFLTVGTSSHDWERLAAVKKQANVPMLNIDVANGYTENFVRSVSKLRDENPDAIIMAGTVVTAEMTEALVIAGADIVRVGHRFRLGLHHARPDRRRLSAIVRGDRMRRCRAWIEGPRLLRRRLHGARRPGQGVRRRRRLRHAGRHAGRSRRMRRRNPVSSRTATSRYRSAWCSMACRRRRP